MTLLRNKTLGKPPPEAPVQPATHEMVKAMSSRRLETPLVTLHEKALNASAEHEAWRDELRNILGATSDADSQRWAKLWSLLAAFDFPIMYHA